MSEGKSIGKKLMGLFVEDENAETAETNISEEAPPPAPPSRPAQGRQGRPPSNPSMAAQTYGAPSKRPSQPRMSPAEETGQQEAVDLSTIDNFGAVYMQSGITDEQTERIEKASQLLATLPQSTPHETKRQIVTASLNAFGIPIDQIAFDGGLQINALESFVAARASHLETQLAAANKKVEELNQMVADLKERMTAHVNAQAELQKKVMDEKARIQGVLDFFVAK